MNVLELFATLSLDSSEYESGLSDAEGKASSFGDGLSTAFKGVSAVVGGTTAVVSGVVAGLSAMATKSASTTDEIDKMSQKLGLSREAYQELDFILSQSGTDISTLKSGMKTLTSALADAQTNADADISSFESLGMSFEQLASMTPEGALFSVLEALQEFPEGAERSALAQELLGKSAQELAPLLNSGAGSIEEMKNQAHELGLVLEDEVIDDGVALNDSLDQVQRMFESLFVQMASDLLPVVNDLMGYIEKLLPYFDQIVTQIAPILGDLLDQLLTPLMDMIDAVLPSILDMLSGSLIPALAELIVDILPIVVNTVQLFLPLIIQVVDAVLPIVMEILPLLFDIINGDLFPVITQLLDSVLPILISLLNMIMPILSPILALLSPLLDLLMTILSPLLDLVNLLLPLVAQWLTFLANTINAVLSPVLNWLSEFIGGLVEKIKDWFANTLPGVWDNFRAKMVGKIALAKANITLFFSNIRDTVEEKFNAIKDKITTVFDTAKDIVKNAIEKIKGFFNFDWSLPQLKMPHFSISGEFSLNPPSIPTIGVEWYAKAMDNGMILNSPTIFGASGGNLLGAGEVGAEVVVGANSLENMIRNAVGTETQVAILRELQNLNGGLYSTMVSALGTMGVKFDERELARLVRKYA